MTWNLLQLDTKKAAESGYRHLLENPFFPGQILKDDEGKPYYIDVIGGDSGKVTEVTRRIADEKLEMIQKTRRIVTESELQRQEDIEIIVAATTGWYLPPLLPDGENPAFSEENAKMIYGDPRFPWIMEQLNKVIGERKHFFKKNSST